MTRLRIGIIVILCLFAFSFRAESKQKLDDILFDLAEAVLGQPSFDYLSQNIGFSDDQEILQPLAEIASAINNKSKNRRAKDISVLESTDINAFAVPGGHIILVLGIFQIVENRDEAACVIGHEVGHLEKRHSLKNFIMRVGLSAITRTLYSKNQEEKKWLQAQYISFLLSRGFSREEEYEADLLSLQYVSDAGYNPNACVSMMKRLAELEAQSGAEFTIESTHPPAADRIQNMKAWLRENGM